MMSCCGEMDGGWEQKGKRRERKRGFYILVAKCILPEKEKFLYKISGCLVCILTRLLQGFWSDYAWAGGMIRWLPFNLLSGRDG